MEESLLYNPWLVKVAAWSAPVSAIFLDLFSLKRFSRNSKSITFSQDLQADSVLTRSENEILQDISKRQTVVVIPAHAFICTLLRTLLVLCLSLLGFHFEIRSFARSFPNSLLDVAVKTTYFLLILLLLLRLDGVLRRESTIAYARLSLLLTSTCSASILAMHGRHRLSVWCLVSVAFIDACTPNYKTLGRVPASKRADGSIDEVEDEGRGCTRPVALGYDNSSFVAGER